MLEEAALTAKDTDTEGESWVVASRLRDHLLSPKERKNSALWKKVFHFLNNEYCCISSIVQCYKLSTISVRLKSQ